jgi:predicted nucleic acid-binding protein
VILYLDTSSLVKLYVDELHAEQVREWVAAAEIVATSRLAYPETLSAFTRRHRSGDFTAAEFATLVGTFTNEWHTFAALDFDEIAAGEMVCRHGLRSFDAVHLASALLLTADQGALDLAFSSFDEQLNRAATAEGITILMPG